MGTRKNRRYRFGMASSLRAVHVDSFPWTFQSFPFVTHSCCLSFWLRDPYILSSYFRSSVHSWAGNFLNPINLTNSPTTMFIWGILWFVVHSSVELLTPCLFSLSPSCSEIPEVFNLGIRPNVARSLSVLGRKSPQTTRTRSDDFCFM